MGIVVSKELLNFYHSIPKSTMYVFLKVAICYECFGYKVNQEPMSAAEKKVTNLPRLSFFGPRMAVSVPSLLAVFVGAVPPMSRAGLGRKTTYQ